MFNLRRCGSTTEMTSSFLARCKLSSSTFEIILFSVSPFEDAVYLLLHVLSKLFVELTVVTAAVVRGTNSFVACYAEEIGINIG